MTAFAFAAETTLEDMLAYLVAHTGTGILHDDNNLAVKIQNGKINNAFTVKIFQRIKGVFDNIAGNQYNIMYRRHIQLAVQLAFLCQRKVDIKFTAAAYFTEDKA